MTWRGLVVLLFTIASLLTACEKSVIVPKGTSLYRPVIEGGECVFLHGDFNSDYDSETSYSSTQFDLTGVLTKVVECPYKRSPEPVKFALIKSGANGLFWAKLSDLRGD